MILDKIIDKKRTTMKDYKYKQGLIAKTMKQSELYLIGEIKKASPSKGIIVENFNVDYLIEEYNTARVDAISILTEENYFMGNSIYLKKARNYSNITLLRKDFIIDINEIFESKNLGANLILLIVAILDDTQLYDFYNCAYALGLECIVEIHNEEELNRALKINPQIIGINNRDLNTFDVTLDTTIKLINSIPKDIAVISESGIYSYDDVTRLKLCGIDGILVGESFMKAKSISEHVKELRYGKG